MERRRVLVFGIDGATFDVVRPAIAKGKLPNLRKLMDEGVWGPLESTIHPVTPMAWSSFATGCNAGKHGIYDFCRRDKDKILLTNASDRKRPSIWSYLSARGRKSIVLNVPFTYPPEEIRGIMIPGFEAPKATRDVFHPESVFDELVERFGEYRFDWTFPIGQRLDLDDYLAHCRRTIEHRGDTSLYLLQNKPWDLFVVVFSTPDHVQHVFWRYPGGMEIIERTYEQVDEYLGRFLSALSDDVTVVVMSDHGFGPIERLVYLDNWLSINGYLARPRVSLRRFVVRSAKTALKRLLPKQMRKTLRSRFSKLKGRLENAEHMASIDWTHSRAYSYGMYGNIYINLKGREPHGIVEPRQYDRLCSEIASKLLELKDPENGRRVVERVYRKTELYEGPFLGDAPDLVVHWRDYAYFTKRGIDRGNDVFGQDLKVDASDYPHTGTHRLHGVFVARGEPICPGAEFRAHIMDLAPTILQILGEPIPGDLDGRVLDDILDCSARASADLYHEQEAAVSVSSKDAVDLSDADEELIQERLRSLGYIE